MKNSYARLFLLTCVIALSSLFIMPVATAQNLISNPGFEDWNNNGAGGPPDSWTVSSSSLTASQEATSIHSGTYSANLTWTTTSTVQLEQLVPITEGSSYELSFWAFDNEAGGRIRGNIRWEDGDGNAVGDYAYSGYSSDQASWQQLSTGAATAPAGAVNALIQLRCYDVSSGWNGSATIFIDDAALSPPPVAIAKVYSISDTELDVIYGSAVSSTNASDFTLTGTQNITFSTATIDGSDARIVHLSGASSSINGDNTVDNLEDSQHGSDLDFYAGIMPIAYTNPLNPGGQIDQSHFATFKAVVSANDNYNNVWISDAAGPYNGALVYDYDFDGAVAVGDDIHVYAKYGPYNDLSELTDPELVNINSSGNTPYGPTLIDGSDLDETIGANTNPAEQYEGQLVKINNFTVDSYTDYDYKCSWTDGSNTYYFHIGDNVDYHLNNISLEVGQSYAGITGVVDWYWSGPYYRINPRGADDIEATQAAARIVGTFQGWNTTDPDYVMSLNANGVYELTKNLDAGDNEYKVIEGDDWAMPNYPNNNQHIILTEATDITWKANINADLVTHTIPVVAGNFISELGGNDWDPSDLTGEMEDPEGDDIFTLDLLVPQGNWEFKVTLNHNWDQSTGGNVGFESDGVTPTTFTYNLATNMTEVTGPPPPTALITFVVADTAESFFDGFYLKGSWDSQGQYDPAWNGGAEHSAFFDDGTNGDEVAGDHIFTCQQQLIVDQGANTWEWGINNNDHEWIVGNWQFTIPDDNPQTLTYSFPGIVDIVITEISYNPPESGTDTLEFLEFYNLSGETINLNGFFISNGVEYTFGDENLASNTYTLVAYSASAMMNTFGVTASEWTSGGLSNGGETVAISDNYGRLIDAVDYDDGGQWPSGADGDGSSLVLCDPTSNNDLAENWSVSMDYQGENDEGEAIFASPGTGCIYFPPNLVITEIMYNPPETGDDTVSFVEIYNNESIPVSLDGYSFTEGIEFEFPYMTLAAGEYLVVAKDGQAFNNTFGFMPLQWTDGSLDNGGEDIEINDQWGFTIDYVEYDDEMPWDTICDGYGPSLTLCNPDDDNELPESWTASLELAAINAAGDTIFASPGAGCGAMAPIADFVANVTQIETGQSVDFTDLSIGTPTSWDWIFEGGTPETSEDQSPQNIVYSTAGTYDVTLTVSNEYGTDVEIKTAYIVVSDPGAPPTADFVASQTEIFIGDAISFTDLSLGDPGTWSWSFEGGTPASSDVQNPEDIIYNTAGSFDVSLTVTNEFGEDTETKSMYITVNEAPLFDIVITEIMYNPPESGTDSLEFIELYNNDDVIVDMEGWMFSSGIEYTFPAISLNPGEYILLAANASAFQTTFGIEATQWTDGALSNGGEEIMLLDATGTIQDALVYEDASPWPEEADGSGPSLTLCNPSNDNSLAENWSASTELAAINTMGDTIWASPGTGCGSIAPIADFMASETVIAPGASIDFTDLSLGNPTAWSWEFEGGTPSTSTDENPMGIVYNTAGEYTVSLTVTNSYGSDTKVKEAYITVGLAPTANFEANTTSIGLGGTVDFSDLSTGMPTQWIWTFEGGNPSASMQQNPSVAYYSAGDFDVSLRVSNVFGDDEIIMTEYIHVVVGTPESVFDKLTVYPNPSSGLFYIENTGSRVEYEIFSVLGEKLETNAIANNKTIIHMNNYPKGIYFVRLTDKESGNSKTLKMILR